MMCMVRMIRYVEADKARIESFFPCAGQAFLGRGEAMCSEYFHVKRVGLLTRECSDREEFSDNFHIFSVDHRRLLKKKGKFGIINLFERNVALQVPCSGTYRRIQS